jgi:alkylhydroperoxidase/carboxymuconolactone decarboxylase family protein YurZ
MEREDAKDLTLSILVIAAALLVADCIWLHVKCARNEAQIAELSELLVSHVAKEDASLGETFAEKAKATYEKVKSAAAKGLEAAKEEYAK